MQRKKHRSPNVGFRGKSGIPALGDPTKSTIFGIFPDFFKKSVYTDIISNSSYKAP